ncbi:nucleoside recognition membrane protein YjiH [Geomicrobium halophilum]|uniref:Nucleoside recognition membrane protein YjiH n=1 Tax=Geomicrobium halophilum TaxID=549000 RepID=A0A841PN20_9BACL|nr:YjiH family protein [Geomicrobium halophilum]MBB6448606.1 nucleoside recognition membrane protein YjiH [Geomicrobium halophilum]
MELKPNPQRSSEPVTRNYLVKFLIFSLIGIFAFFVPFYILAVILMGAVYPFYNRTWTKDITHGILSFFKIIGALVMVMFFFQMGPQWLFHPDMAPYLVENLVIPVGLLVPIGAVFLAFLAGYGLLEFIGVMMQPVMRPLWKTPGKSAIDAMASFVGSYSIGLLITNRVFKEGKYTVQEASIIATGFSTVSATFMIVVANTLGLMEFWNLYFWVTLFVTFTVTAITVRIWPLNKMSTKYIHKNIGQPEERIRENRIKAAWTQAMEAAASSHGVGKTVWLNLKDGFIMTMSILPTILSIGILGLFLVEYTPVFNVLSYLFLPVTWLMQIPDPLLAAEATVISITEMFLPAVLAAEAPLVTRFIVGTLSVSAILFFSASIPAILATDIPISIPKLMIIWVERSILTLVLVTPIAYLFFGFVL